MVSLLSEFGFLLRAQFVKGAVFRMILASLPAPLGGWVVARGWGPVDITNNKLLCNVGGLPVPYERPAPLGGWVVELRGGQC